MNHRPWRAAAGALLLALPAPALEPCGDWQRVYPWPTRTPWCPAATPRPASPPTARWWTTAAATRRWWPGG